jgi:hypothetical protein
MHGPPRRHNGYPHLYPTRTCLGTGPDERSFSDSLPSIRPLQNHWEILLKMPSSSPDDSAYLCDSLSPQELSCLAQEPAMHPILTETFRPGSATTILLRYYEFISTTIDTLERELERHQMDRERLFDHMMGSKRFRQRIHPVLEEFRQFYDRQHRTRYHPYGHTPSPLRTPSNPMIEGSPTTPSNVQTSPEQDHPSTPYLRLSTPHVAGKIEEHIKLEDCDATLNTEPIEGLTDGEDDEEHDCAGCQGEPENPEYSQ